MSNNIAQDFISISVKLFTFCADIQLHRWIVYLNLHKREVSNRQRYEKYYLYQINFKKMILTITVLRQFWGTKPLIFSCAEFLSSYWSTYRRVNHALIYLFYREVSIQYPHWSLIMYDNFKTIKILSSAIRRIQDNWKQATGSLWFVFWYQAYNSPISHVIHGLFYDVCTPDIHPWCYQVQISFLLYTRGYTLWISYCTDNSDMTLIWPIIPIGQICK